MRYRLTVLAIIFAAIAGWSLTGSTQALPVRPAPTAAKPIAGKASSESRPAFQLQGAASCASMACHNAGGIPGFPGGEYGLALERDSYHVKDRHAQAYAILLEDRSKKVQQKLSGMTDWKNAHPEHNEVCLRCHVHPQFNSPARVINEVKQFRFEEGVSCEACHGPAEKWLGTHFRTQRSDAERLAEGQYDTRSLMGRIHICADCHIGKPGMEVNHDLIAAGHPRLTFEFSSFHSILHKHWNPGDPQAGEHFEARAWLMGQLAVAQASLRLLADRADPKNGRVWPEFAEHDCFACHHTLEPNTKRQERGYEKHKPGVMPINPWYTVMLDDALKADGKQATDNLVKVLENLHKAMDSFPVPDRASAAINALLAADLLEKRLAALSAGKIDATAIMRQLESATSKLSKRADTREDDAIQFYLAREALKRIQKQQHLPFAPLLPRTTLRTLLQLPDGDRLSAIDPDVFRSTLEALKKK